MIDNRRSRLKTVIITLFVCYIIILIRLFYWQIIKNSDLHRKVTNQNFKPSVILPLRGLIYDTQNHPLAQNLTLYRLSLYKPDLKQDFNTIFTRIITANSDISADDQLQLQNFNLNPSQKWISLKTLFTESQRKILDSSGFTFDPIYTRAYPENDLAKTILGNIIVNQDGDLTPLGGLESYYQKQLDGRSGFVWESKDATGQTVLSKPAWKINAIDGRNLHTSLDRRLQSLVETTLKIGISNFSADSGSISIITPHTGQILAMASFEATSSATASANKNPVISDLFEPGSIFKPLIVSMALDAKSITTDFICTKCNQPHQIGQYAISNWDNSFHPDSTLRDIIKNSDNIGMSYIIDRLGLESFLSYYQRLGFTRKTGIDLQGEAKPITKSYWPEIDLATASFGQGFAVTQIQMLSAFNTIANNGFFVEPRLVPYFEENGHIYPNKQPPAVSVFSPQTITNIKSILKYSVDNGVVSKFKPENLEVCAKSGTAQVAVKGGYSESATIASYIGFSPCQNPKFTMIVTIRNPKTSPWGSSTAAPIWYDLAAKITPLL